MSFFLLFQVGPLFHEASELAEALEFDLETGLHRCDVLPQVKDEKGTSRGSRRIACALDFKSITVID